MGNEVKAEFCMNRFSNFRLLSRIENDIKTEICMTVLLSAGAGRVGSSDGRHRRQRRQRPQARGGGQTDRECHREKEARAADGAPLAQIHRLPEVGFAF